MLLQRVGNHGIGLGTLFERAAVKHPSNVVILDHDLDTAPERGRRMTVPEVADLVADHASRLWAAGVRPGEHVVVYKSESFDITLLACSIARIGAIPVLLSPQLDGGTVAELLRRTQQPWLITDAAKLTRELGDSASTLVAGLVLLSGYHDEGIRFDELAGCSRVRAVPMPADHPALITHTSGTTGTPKLAVHTGRTLQARYRPQACAVALLRKRETVAIHVSFVHSRLITALAISLLRGFPIAVLANGDPGHVADTFARVRPGILEAHPNSYMSWEEIADDPRRPLSNVKLFSSTFDALHPRTVRRLLGASRRRLPLFGQLYGQSEIGPAVGSVITRAQRAETDGRRVGVPFPGMTGVRVVSRDGNRPTRESPGYIEVRSDGRIVTYLGEHERFERQTDGPWWRMGDLGYRSKTGFLHLLDREVDEIPGFGSTLAVEDALFSKLDQLAEVIIVPDGSRAPVPVVSTKDDVPLDERAWREAVSALPTMAHPVQRRHADLPQTATKKIKRLELAEQLGTTAVTS